MSSTRRRRDPTSKDFYPTPPYAIEPMVENAILWPDNPTILEPCKGTGVIIAVLSSYLPDAKFTWCEINEGRDYFKYRFSNFDFVITNPPFSQAQAFIDKSLGIADCTVMLLPLSFLASKKRKPWWQDKVPTAIHVLSKRPSFTGDGRKDSNEYGWFVWDKTGKQKRGLHWL